MTMRDAFTLSLDTELARESFERVRDCKTEHDVGLHGDGHWWSENTGKTRPRRNWWRLSRRSVGARGREGNEPGGLSGYCARNGVGGPNYARILLGTTNGTDDVLRTSGGNER